MDNNNNRKRNRRKRGIPRTQSNKKQIIEDIGKTNYKELKIVVKDRDQCRSIKVIDQHKDCKKI